MEQESKFEHHKRLVYGKLKDKTLADVDYTELAEFVYGQPYSSDVARRMLYGSRRTLDLLEEEGIKSVSDKDILDDIDKKMLELRKERQKFYDQRREYNKLVSIEGRQEHLYDSLIDAAYNLSDTVGSLFDRTEPVILNPTNNEAVLVFSDWHYGMKAQNVFNTYNTDICKERVANIVRLAAKKLLLHQCSKLHIVVLGDLYHGAIHTSARVASEELVCDQIMQVSEILAQSIVELSQYTTEVCVYMTYGNHARTVQNKNDSIHRDNMERLIPWWLKERLSNLGADNVVIMPESDSEFLFINAAGHDICASHGDLDGAKSSPRLLSTLFQKTYKKDIEYILLGDKHHHESFEELGITSQICGSLCGSDDYANGKRLFSLPSQFMLIVDAEDGIDAEYKLRAS